MITKMQILPPANWQDFEELCMVLWRSIWSDPNTKKNGRAGQNQHGVDVYGLPINQRKYSGVQCKGKDNYTKKQLTETELIEEAKKAKEFEPLINNFIIATTAPSDTNIQKRCREINLEKKFPFPISIWSWNDISDEIQNRPDVFQSMYGQQLQIDIVSNEIHIGKLEGLDRIQSFLSRDYIKKQASPSVILLLNKLLYEFADNAFNHGSATQINLAYKDNTFIFSDNGKFYKTNELNITGHGGTETYKYFRSLFSDDELVVNYEYTEEYNIFKMSFASEALHKEINATEVEVVCTTNISHTIDQALSSIVPLAKKGQRVKLLIKDDFVLSSAQSYLKEIFDIVGDCIDSVCIPNHPLAGHLIKTCEKYNVKYILR